MSTGSKHVSILVVGAGTAGISVAARLRNLANAPEVALLDPSEHHYYQPLWTMVGAGVVSKESTRRPQADYIPDGVAWIRDSVAGFDPEHNAIDTKASGRITYDQLVIALGIQLDWNKIDGLPDALGKDGIVSNYRYDLVDSTWAALQAFRGGNAIFTFPSTPIKCAGAPQKIMYLADDYLRRQGVRDKSRVIFGSAGQAIFGVAKYRKALEKVVAKRNIETMFRHDLIAVRPNRREAVFRHLDENRDVVVDYDLLHVVPPQSAPDVIKQSPVAGAAGWVDVDKYSLQHTRFPNVFSLGDCSSLPCSRTGAAIRKQAPVLVDNLMALRAGLPLTARYDGYASCPLVTGYGKLILAEFDYDGNPAESFPFDQAQERYSMYALKLHALPELYWNGMLRGRM
jgi:sulfide:quinone oxidoreductase